MYISLETCVRLSRLSPQVPEGKQVLIACNFTQCDKLREIGGVIIPDSGKPEEFLK